MYSEVEMTLEDVPWQTYLTSLTLTVEVFLYPYRPATHTQDASGGILSICGIHVERATLVDDSGDEREASQDELLLLGRFVRGDETTRERILRMCEAHV